LIACTTLQNSLFRPVTGLLSTGVSAISSLAPFAQIFEIDGTGLRDLRLADLAAIVGVVSQETYLLHATVRENLRYAKPGATDAEIEDAARAAQIHDLIAGLPDGYDTMVGSRGHRFSGGEKQRIAIARTLLRDPRVLVLDEATSAQDTDTERAVQQAFDTLARAAPRPPSRIGCPPSAMPTRSPCRITAGSSRSATTPACSPATAATPNWPQRPSMRRRSLGWLSVARSRSREPVAGLVRRRVGAGHAGRGDRARGPCVRLGAVRWNSAGRHRVRFAGGREVRNRAGDGANC
jgi:ABC-type uncharacterized transport system YnjBCD ATPase subunit